VSGAELPQAALHWEARYAAEGRLWGDGPSELALLAVARLQPYATPELTVLDVGCGYGRDTRYLAAELGCRALGLDPSPAAITAARRQRSTSLDVDFVTADLVAFAAEPENAGRFDVVFACNVYHLLGPIGRREFAAALGAAARPGGLLFLSTLSPRDPQHYAVGRQVRGEERSWVDKVYLHFCSADELVADLRDFELLDVDERSYEERNPGGLHHHTSWFVEGRRR
jgi:SAM-dependent methyltransferase